jgi:hypothetical protein
LAFIIPPHLADNDSVSDFRSDIPSKSKGFEHLPSLSTDLTGIGLLALI